jgi:hypothetical protein
MPAEHIVRVGRIESSTVDLFTGNEPKVALDALRDELLIQAWG